VRIGDTVLSLVLLVGLSLAVQTADANVPSGAGVSSFLPMSEVVRGPEPSLAIDAPGDTLHVDLEAYNNALGLSTGGTFYAAARLSPAKACTVSTVIFYKWDASYDDYLFVWGKGTNTEPGQLIESVPYSGATTMAWQTVNLPILVALSGASDDIWVGPRISHGGGTYPLGVDDGPAVVTRGGWINSDGRWVELRSVGDSVNWHIRALLGHGGIPLRDIATDVVLAPKDTVESSPAAPMVRIRNCGANPVYGIPLTCRIDSLDSVVFTSTTTYMDMLAPSESAVVAFPDSWTGVAHTATYEVSVFTSLPGDSNFANDTAYASIIPAIDLGAVAVLAPKDTVAGPVAPQARIRNLGFNAVGDIPVVCQIDSANQVVFADTTTYAGPLAPSETASVTFPKSWTGVAHKAHYRVAVFTKLPEDSVPANDTAYGAVVPAIDVGADSVLAPNGTVAPGPVAPKAEVRNLGFSRVDSVRVICRIDSAGSAVFTDTTYTGAVNRAATANVTFPKSWTGVDGSDYEVVVFTELPEDSVQANDTVRAVVAVRHPAIEEQPAQLGVALAQVLPTLVRDRVRIEFTVAHRGAVNLSVYDACGSLIRTLVSGMLEPGSHTATWDRTDANGSHVAKGTYLYRLVAGGQTVAGKAIVLK
jgi:hypothetical protein